MSITAGASLERSWLVAACCLSLAAAVSLGLARFAYGLLLPPMRADLGWSYFTAGAMNTINAAGYLAGALCAPWVLARWDARRVVIVSGLVSVAVLAAHAMVRSEAALLLLRCASGMASAGGFVGGGLLAARLASLASESAGMPGRPGKGAGREAGVNPGLVLGLFYGGTGVGIVAASLALPPWLAQGATAWPGGWLGIAVLAAIGTAVAAWGTRGLLQAAPAAQRQPGSAPAAQRQPGPAPWRGFALGLAGYAMFGIGYIGYMTFVITLLREQGWSSSGVGYFYAWLGVGVMASSWIWAGLLQRHRDGKPLALLNGLLAVATLLPVLSVHPAVVLVSGGLFGAVFLSVVASTTALVRHNLPAAAWPAGISAFTIVFALGQIIGPSLVGQIADGPGGLLRGFAISAGVLALGSVLALGQRPLPAAAVARG